MKGRNSNDAPMNGVADWLRRMSLVPVVSVAVALGCNGGTARDGVNGANRVALSAETERPPYRSRCALNAIECTSCWPVPDIQVAAGEGQTVTGNAEDNILVEGSSGAGFETIQLIGSGSQSGSQTETLFYSWSSLAVDDDPETAEPGPEFSVEADPQVILETGFHYIRLTVRNDVACDVDLFEPFDPDTGEGGTTDFVEVQIEVRN